MGIGFKRVIIIVLALLLFAFSFFFLTTREFTFEGFYFDTYITGKIHSSNPVLAKKVISKIKNEFKRIDSLKVKGIKNGETDTTLLKITERSLYFSHKTSGYFDPTIDPILRKWNYFKKPTLPSQKEIKALLPLVNYRQVEVKSDILSMPKEFSLNLGGIAKGYALDRAKGILKKYNISSALIDAGGDILTVGKKKGETDWKIGIRDPRNKKEIIGVLKADSCFIFTSGDYERYFTISGKRYHHIVNPFTGFPSREIASATVIIEGSGIKADCIATALMCMGIKKARKYIEDNGIEAILIDTSENILKFIENEKVIIYE